MRRPTSERSPQARVNAPYVLFAVLGSLTMGWLGLYGFAWSDYETEALPALHALTHGQLEHFLALAPAYGGSLVLRAPFALLPSLWGGGDLAVYRMVALPCLLAAAALGVWLTTQMRSGAHRMLARALALGLCVANPLTLRALELGHPEELLGAVLCVTAVLLAARNRPLLAGLALGAAIANKEWALLAIGPVLLALPYRRILCMTLTGAIAASVLGPLALAGSSASGFVAAARGSALAASTIFQPWQIWWFLGHHGQLVHGLFGTPKPGYRTAPGWIDTVSHPLIIALMVPLTGALWLARRRLSGPSHRHSNPVSELDALLLLSLLLLLRCMLDTWDTVYYLLPFLFAVLVWESLSQQRPALLSLCCTLLAWIGFVWMGEHASPDLQAAFFLVWSLPLAAALSLALYAPARSRALLARVSSMRIAPALAPDALIRR